MPRSNKWTMWTTDDATNTNGDSVEFLLNHDGDATTFFWSGRVAKNGAWEDNSELCPRFSAKQDAFYEKCGGVDPNTGVIVLGGWGACEEILIGTGARLLAGKSSSSKAYDVTASCPGDCTTCLLTVCDSDDNCDSTSLAANSDTVVNSAGITFASLTLQDYCGT